jgi:hypothetical protein
VRAVVAVAPPVADRATSADGPGSGSPLFRRGAALHGSDAGATKARTPGQRTGHVRRHGGVMGWLDTGTVAGFASVAAVGKSIEAVLNAGYALVQPVEGHTTQAVLIQTEDLDPANEQTKIARPGLSILLYRVDFNKTVRAGWSAVGQRDGRAHLPLDLHYLLTAWADNADHEQRVIARSMQVLEELGALSGPLLHPDGGWAPGEAVQLYLEDIPTDDLMRTFDSLPCDFRLSVPYLTRVVVVSGDDGVPPTDVTTVVRGLRPDGTAPVTSGART